MLTIILLTVLIAFFIAKQWMKRFKMPPGPIPLPLLGNLPQLALAALGKEGMVGAMERWKKEYGSVFTLWFGPMATVHLVDLQTANEVMVKEGSHYADRWIPDLMDVTREGQGISGTNGDHWSEQRRFALHSLRNFGLGRNLMEERIMMEVDARLGDVSTQLSSGDSVLDPAKLFDLLVGSIINRMLFSVRFDEGNQEEFFSLKHAVDQMVENVSIVDFSMKKWWLKIPFVANRYNKLLSPAFKLKDFIRKQVRERIASVESGEHVLEDEGLDYVDAFLIKMRKEQGDKNTTFNEPSLVVNLMDIWVAGQETTTTTLLWATTLFINNPEVQSKVREEVSEVTGDQRSLSLQDKQDTPYLNATIMEIQRHASILNMNLWRQPSHDMTINGYTVEAGTPTTAQISVIMKDEHFKDGEKFLPDRFLSDGTLSQYMIPFGIGKRVCLGESLARAELYLIIGNLLNRFDLLPSGPDAPPTSAANGSGVMHRPQKFNIVMKSVRNS